MIKVIGTNSVNSAILSLFVGQQSGFWEAVFGDQWTSPYGMIFVHVTLKFHKAKHSQSRSVLTESICGRLCSLGD